MTQFSNNKINYTEIYSVIMQMYMKVQKIVPGLVNTCYVKLHVYPLRGLKYSAG